MTLFIDLVANKRRRKFNSHIDVNFFDIKLSVVLIVG